MQNKDQAIIHTRKELYDIVWKEPITKLAKGWSISDVGLAKICRRHEIPLPPRGYWAKLKYGKSLAKRPSLPKTRPEDENVIISSVYNKFSSVENKHQLKEYVQTLPNFTVPDCTSSKHFGPSVA